MIGIREYEAGEVIFNENDPGETAYIIESGRVEVLKTLAGKRVHLAYIGSGEPFGEMSMIDEKPRSATIVAVERTRVRELHREDFVQNLQTHPELTIGLLRLVFERLREADATILEIYRAHPELQLLQPAGIRTVSLQPTPAVIYLEGLTPQATEALPQVPFPINKFPFRIGRLSSDPLAHNDLYIPDSEPMQVSRNHLSFIKSGERIGVRDRGSRLGSLVDGQQIGGDGDHPSSLFFSGPEGRLVLGDKVSPFIFKVTIRSS